MSENIPATPAAPAVPVIPAKTVKAPAKPKGSGPAITKKAAAVIRTETGTAVVPVSESPVTGAAVVDGALVAEPGLPIVAAPTPVVDGPIVTQPTTRPLDDRNVVF